MEERSVRETLPKIFDGDGSTPPVPPPPPEYCGDCGKEIEYAWVGEKMRFLFKRLGMKAPGWRAVPCSCRVLLRPDRSVAVEARLRRSGVKERFFGKTFRDFIVENESQAGALAASRDFVESFKEVRESGTWLLFMGGPGTGKTLLACIIVQELIRAGYSAMYVKAREVFRRIKESWDRSGESETEIIRELVGVDLLVLDDVGVQFGSMAEQGILYDVLDGRYERKKPLVATSHRGYDELRETIGRHNLDRFQDRPSGSRLFIFDWPSYRSGL